MIIGIIFCQVDKIKQFNHVILFIILTNHKWKGGNPNFINKDKFIIILIHKKFLLRFNKIEFDIKIKIDDLIVWIIKYLNDKSLKYLFVKIIIGIKFNIFNSIIIHIENHELQDIVIKGEMNNNG